MIFEGNNKRVIVPLDPSKGVRYTKLAKEGYCTANIDNIYQMIMKEHDCLNSTIVENFSLERDISCTSDSKEFCFTSFNSVMLCDLDFGFLDFVINDVLISERILF